MWREYFKSTCKVASQCTAVRAAVSGRARSPPLPHGRATARVRYGITTHSPETRRECCRDIQSNTCRIVFTGGFEGSILYYGISVQTTFKVQFYFRTTSKVTRPFRFRTNLELVYGRVRKPLLKFFTNHSETGFNVLYVHFGTSPPSES